MKVRTRMLELSINDTVQQFHDIDEIEDYVSNLLNQTGGEVWLFHPSGSRLCVLFNQARAFVMWMSEEGTSSFSSRDLNCPNGEERFLLSNGQYDTYPSSWTVNRQQARDALVYQAKHGQRCSSVTWHDDSLG